MSWDRWIANHYDDIIWSDYFRNTFLSQTETFWIAVAITAGIPVGIILSPILIPAALLAAAGWGIYELIYALAPYAYPE